MSNWTRKMKRTNMPKPIRCKKCGKKMIYKESYDEYICLRCDSVRKLENKENNNEKVKVVKED